MKKKSKDESMNYVMFFLMILFVTSAACTGDVPVGPAELGLEGAEANEDVVGALWDTVVGFLPILGVMEGILALLFARKRKHYETAIKALLPYNARVEVVTAIKAIGRALGAMHSSAASEEAANSEE